jgi:hypothetical protein
MHTSSSARRTPGLLALLLAVATSAGLSAQAPTLAGSAQGFGGTTSTVLDVDRDGIPDLVSVLPDAPAFPPPLRILWSRGRGDGSFESPQTLFDGVPYPLPASVFLPQPLALDADDDGLDDLLLVQGGVYRARSGGGFDDAVPLPPVLATTVRARDLAVADLTGDGRQDILAPGANGSELLLLGNRGDLTFDVTIVHAEALGAWMSVAAAPVNADALPDAILVSGLLGEQTLSVFVSIGGGAFAPPSTLPLTSLSVPGVIRSADIEGDGDLDLLVDDYIAGSGTFVILLNAGDGTFTEGPVISDPTAADLDLHFEDILDVDGDGTLDAVMVSATQAYVGVLPGRPGGGFAPLRSFSIPDGLYNTGFLRAELDGDPSPEFLVTSFFHVLVMHGGGPFLDLGGGEALPARGIRMSATGGTQPGSRTEVSLHVPQPGTLAMFVLGTDLPAAPGLPLSVVPASTRVVFAPTTLWGRWPAGLPDGTTHYVQAWVDDGAGGVTTSNVVALVADTP